MRTITCEMKGYIQPFERLLAVAELRALAAGEPEAIGAKTADAIKFKVQSSADLETLRTQLAYWQTVGTNTQQITEQIRVEATSLIARNGVALENLARVVPSMVDTKLPNKRCLRYATHGLHEYRGKFFPQLVRALLNMARVPSDGVVLDPMCGSGTTLVESAISGRTSYGIDMNPLSVFVSDAKCDALRASPKTLISSFEEIKSSLETHRSKRNEFSYFLTLAAVDQDYLSRWYAPHVLDELDRIKAAISTLRDRRVRTLYTLCLSNILRSVSWQKDDDLRVRKDVKSIAPGEVTARYLDEILRATKSVAAFSVQQNRAALGRHIVMEGDARHTNACLPNLVGKADAIITSPPYATALPYLDTDRLSLIYLGLLPRNLHREKDAAMIGNREVTERARQRLWETYERDRQILPKRTRSLIERIDRLNSRSDAGFRRKNLAALLAKYFFDMRSVLETQRMMLKPNGSMFVVIGNNRTNAGGVNIQIPTATHLTDIAASVGLKLIDELPMEMLVSRDIFRKNTTPSEQVLTFQRDQ